MASVSDSFHACPQRRQEQAKSTTAASDLIAISGDPRLDDLGLSDIEHRFVCEVFGKRGADVRPDFNWNRG
jgi:hypothetical protein